MLTRNIGLIKNGPTFHMSCVFNAKPGKVMRKFMGEPKKKKFYPADTPVLPSSSNIFGKTPFESKITGNPRRSSVLNKLFMRHITDLMATGEYSREILGYGIEVNKVKITPDYRILKVYWIANKTEDYESIENILLKNAGFLRNELSQLRVMGEVPKIVFVKDKNYSKIAEVEKKLAMADFGEDYHAVETIEKLKSEFEIWTTLDTTVKEKLERLDLKSMENEGDLSEIPPMPQNVLGLDHAEILNRIKTSMSASKAPHREGSTGASEWLKWSEFKATQTVNSDPVGYANQQEQRVAFKEFWQQRQILKMKQQRRLDKNWTPDIELLREERREKHLKSLGNWDLDSQEEDFVLEDLDDNVK